MTAAPAQPDLMPTASLPAVAFFNRGEGLYQTGGYLYNQYIRDAIAASGTPLTIYDNANQLSCISRHQWVIIDSLMMPELAAEIVQKEMSPILIYHLPPDLANSPHPSDDLIKQAESQSQIVVTGDASYRHMQERLTGNQGNMRKIEPGVPVNWRSKSRWSNTPGKLLMVASYQPDKGLELLFKILSEVAPLPWTLEVIGETKFCPNFKAELQQRLVHLGLAHRVILHGPMTHQKINQAMLNADLLLQLSAYETYSMVTAEAIAAGLPVLSTPTGNQHSFSNSGRVRYLPSFSPDDTLFELRDLLSGSDNYQKMIGPKTQLVRTWESVKQEFMAFINSGANNNRPLTTSPDLKQEQISNGI